MDDRFDDIEYAALLARLSAENPLVRFADLAEGPWPERFVILRHDVDYSPVAALRLARLEAQRGLRASYFLLPGSLYYSLLDPAHAALPARLVELGHEVGLHYDVRFFRAFPRERWEELLLAQAGLLERLSGEPVRAIAMHQPGLNGEDPFRTSTRFLNAYADPFFHEIPYLSDSCRAWRDSAWAILAGASLPPRLQLCLHPINWAAQDRARETIFAAVHDELARRTESAKAELLAQIAVHPAVVEHQARRARES